MNNEHPEEINLSAHIRMIRGRKVILDFDLASLYGVSTGRLNEQVKRNLDRFPADFMFQLTEIEEEHLISQFAISKFGRGGRRFLPNAFTEHGVLMAANVLNNDKAISVSIEIVRTFVRLRQSFLIHDEFRRKLNELEEKYDKQFQVIFEAIEVTPKI